MARGNRQPGGACLPLLDHVPDRAVRADRRRRLRLPAALIEAVRAAEAHQQLIDDLFDYDDAAGSLDRLNAAAKRAGDPEHSVMLTQVARALGLAGRFKDAEVILDSGTSDDPEVALRVLLERGRVLNSSGRSVEARPLFEAAFAAAVGGGFEHLAVDALHMVAIVAPPDEQDTLNRRALEMADGATDPRARQWRASLLNNIGWTAFERGEYGAALAFFEDALAARLEHGKPADVRAARWCVGRTLRAMGRTDEALALQRSLAADLVAAGATAPYVDDEIAALTQTSTTPEPGTG